MNKEIFTRRRTELIALTNTYLAKQNLPKQEEISCKAVLKILNEYSFENRMELKGLLSHTIIDSLELDNSLSNECHRFDDDIK